MEDIAPILLKEIEELFEKGKENNAHVKTLVNKLKDKKAGYIEAGEYADELGKILAEAYGEVFTMEILPDGKLYYNIATRTVTPTMKGLQAEIADFSKTVQEELNKNAKLGLKPIKAELNQDKIDGIVDRLSNAESFDDIKWILDEPIKTFARSVVDDSIKANADFQGKAGLTPKIIRRSTGNCCEWCTSLEGTYDYPNVPKDVYRRHNRCRCTVDFVTGKRKQNVWTKAWSEEVEPEKIEERKSAKYGEGITDYAARRRERMAARNAERIKTEMKPKIESMSASELKDYANNSLQTEFIGLKGANSDFIRETVKVIDKFERLNSGTIEGLKIQFGGTPSGVYAKYDDKTNTILLKKTGDIKSFEKRRTEENIRYRLKWKTDKDYHATTTYLGTVAHELGHAVDSSTKQELSRALSSTARLDELSVKISSYAGSSQGVRVSKRSEAWAENFAAYMEGGEKAKDVPKEIQEMIEGYFKKK